MIQDQRIELGTLNLSSVVVGIISSIDDVRNYNFLAKGLSKMPVPLQTRVARDYVARYNRSNNNAKLNANVWLRRTVDKLEQRFGTLFSITQNMPLPWNILSNKDKTKKHAEKVALECVAIIADLSEELTHQEYDQSVKHVFEKIGNHCQSFGIYPQYWHSREEQTIEALEISLLKVQCEKWWARQLKTVRSRYLELLEIATGQVGKDIKRKGISPYSSKQAQGEFIEARRSGREFLGKMELESDTGAVIDLLTAVDAGMANPVNRRNELMLRMRETEELATEMGYVGVFYTLTCPSKYHPNSDKWNGATPKDAQSYLVQTWSRARSKLNRLGLNYFGIRVAEPHADSCPHWHMMLFIPKNKVQWVNAIIRKYFISEDRDELIKRYDDRPNLVAVYKKQRQKWGYKKSQGIKAKEPQKFYRTFTPRFTAVLMDPSKGSAAGYIAKYISKNIDGYQVSDHEDDETGESIKVNPVLCWASTWGIRQFQFQGSPSVTVYRELRKQREKVDHVELEQVRDAADRGSWIDFVKLMGGMCIGRDANFKTAYEETPFGNKYGEAVRRVKGVSDIEQTVSLLTRVTQWVKQLKGTAAIAAAELGFVVADDQSWTSGNNCTPMAAEARANKKLSRLGLASNQVNELKKGKRIKVDDRILVIDDQKLTILEDENQRDLQKRNEISHFANVHAIQNNHIYRVELKNTNGGPSTWEWRGEPPQESWGYAKELVDTAFVKANNEGRSMPITSDWVYAREIVDGKAEADWWDAGLRSA